jgi:hypothetical protein
MNTVHFCGQWQLDFPQTKAAYEAAAAGNWARQVRKFPELADIPGPSIDSAAQAEKALSSADQALAPFKAAIADPNVLDDEVLIRYAGVHEPDKGWGQDFVGFDAYVSRTDAPDQPPLIVRKHLPEPLAEFWPRVIEAAKALNRSKTE